MADEVRVLAQRYTAAARETAQKIADSVRKSQQGAAISDQVSQSLGEIQQGVRQLDALVSAVTTASQEQTQGIGQVNTTVGQMDHVTQSNAANAEESAAAAEQLSAQSHALKAAVTQLRELIRGRASARLAPPVTSPRPDLSRSRTAYRRTQAASPSSRR